MSSFPAENGGCYREKLTGGGRRRREKKETVKEKIGRKGEEREQVRKPKKS